MADINASLAATPILKPVQQHGPQDAQIRPTAAEDDVQTAEAVAGADQGGPAERLLDDERPGLPAADGRGSRVDVTV